MPDRARVPVSATLAADELIALRRSRGERVLSLASGEIGLPVHPALKARLAVAAGRTEYGPVAGSAALRQAAAGYWRRRGLRADPDLVVCGPGSKPLLFGLLLAIGGDVVIPVPSWVSYAAHAQLAGARPIPVPILPGQGGVPDPTRLRRAVIAARAAGRDPRAVVVTVPDNPTGTIAAPETIRRVAEVARELDLVVISDEIYCDLVFDVANPGLSPAAVAPERTVVTTGLTKSLAAGGWRLGVARLPGSDLGRSLHAGLVGVASQIWSSAAAPVQAAAAYAFAEPPELIEYVAACRRLHAAVARAVAGWLATVGAVVAPVRATCYLYPDFEPLRGRLGRDHRVHTAEQLADHLLARHGMGVLPGSVFGERTGLRLRLSTSCLYGETDEQRRIALRAADPLEVPWIRASVDRIGEILTLIAGSTASYRDAALRS